MEDFGANILIDPSWCWLWHLKTANFEITCCNTIAATKSMSAADFVFCCSCSCCCDTMHCNGCNWDFVLSWCCLLWHSVTLESTTVKVCPWLLLLVVTQSLYVRESLRLVLFVVTQCDSTTGSISLVGVLCCDTITVTDSISACKWYNFSCGCWLLWHGVTVQLRACPRLTLCCLSLFFVVTQSLYVRESPQLVLFVVTQCDSWQYVRDCCCLLWHSVTVQLWACPRLTAGKEERKWIFKQRLPVIIIQSSPVPTSFTFLHCKCSCLVMLTFFGPKFGVEKVYILIFNLPMIIIQSSLLPTSFSFLYNKWKWKKNFLLVMLTCYCWWCWHHLRKQTCSNSMVLKNWGTLQHILARLWL